MKTEGSISGPKRIQPVFETQDSVVALADIAEFGADPTGTTDATTAIQTALNAVGKAGGGTVWAGKGIYRLCGNLEIPPAVTLRGEYNPDVFGEPGAVFVADVAPEKNPSDGLIRLLECSGVRGITIVYPAQNPEHPLTFAPTFFLPGGIKLRSVTDCTLIGAYIGAKIEYNETSNLRNLRGTCLKTGIEIDSVGDVGVFESIHFSPCYMASCRFMEKMYDEQEITGWMKAHKSCGLLLHDMEQQQFSDIRIEGYTYGIFFSAQPTRFMGSGTMFGLHITDCTYGLYAESGIYRSDCGYAAEAYPLLTSIDWRCGYAISASVLSGDEYAIYNGCEPVKWWYDGRTYQGTFRLTDVELQGKVSGSVLHTGLDGKHLADGRKISPRPPTNPRGSGFRYLHAGAPEEEIQNALTCVGEAGGGIVFLEPGKYEIRKGLVIPEGTELCGAVGSSARVPNRGTVLYCAQCPCDSAQAKKARPLITLSSHSGVRGLYVLYEKVALAIFARENPPRYPTAIRGRGEGIWCVDCCIGGAWRGIDFRNCPGHLISNLISCCLENHISVSGGQGQIRDSLANGTVIYRTGGVLPMDETNIQTDFFDRFTRPFCTYIRVEAGDREEISNVFIYGGKHLLEVDGAKELLAVNACSDALGKEALLVHSGDVTLVNTIITSADKYRIETGSVRILNPMRNHEPEITDISIEATEKEE